MAAILMTGAANAQPGPARTLPSQSLAPAASFSTDQRAEIVQVIRDALRSDPSILREAIATLQQDELRQQAWAVRSAIASQRHALIDDAADPTAGATTPDATIVEFYDTRCPYCRRLLPTMAALLKADPTLRVVYKDLPILGPSSTMEARALLAAQRQGGYAKMQEAVMHESAPATLQGLQALAARVGLDGARLRQDMDDPLIQARLDGNLALARALHVEGTPAFVIGTRLIPGAVELADLQDAVTAARTP